MGNRRQPQRLPPPISHGPEAIDGEVILREVQGHLGLLLWKTVRSVRLWSDVGDSERSSTFHGQAYDNRLGLLERADAPEGIRSPLLKAAAVLRPRARSATVGAAARSIGTWAERQGALGTAVEFLQAAALALPLDAELAYEVARLARARTEYQRAETWYRQAISRARRTQNRYEFARSYIGLGSIFILRGNYPQAKRNLIRGLRAAKRFSIRPLVGAAYHELATVAIRTHSAADAHRYTRAALDTYGKDNPKLPCLGYEYGVFLLESGHFSDALRMIASVPVEIIRPLERLARAAAVVRAAGAARDKQAYEQAWKDAEKLLKDPAAGQGAASALLSLALGARSAGELDRARRSAEEARRLASERGEAEVEFAATELSESLRNGASAPAEVEPRKSSPKVRHLVQDLGAALEGVQHV